MSFHLPTKYRLINNNIFLGFKAGVYEFGCIVFGHKYKNEFQMVKLI